MPHRTANPIPIARGARPRRPWARAVVLPVILLLAAFGCGKGARDLMSTGDATVAPSSQLRITAHLSRAAAGRFTARFELTTPEGASVTGFEYALDPPAQGEPAWQSAPAGPLALTLDRRPGRAYVLVTRVPGSGGAASTASIVFTADDVLASATIDSPHPTHEVAITTPTAFTVQWVGNDPEAPGGVPTGYLTRLVTAADINPDNPNALTAFQVNQFFANDLATNRGAWTQTALTQQALSGLAPFTTYLFAVSALDAGGLPGASDTTFNLDRNVLQFRPTTEQIGPRLTVFNAFFSRTKQNVSLDPTPQITIQVGAGEVVPFNWFGIPMAGVDVGGYRWVLDPADLADESPRRNANDLAHWSAWSLTTTTATVGPFRTGDVKKDNHRMCIEVRDSFGDVNLFVVGIDVVGRLRPARDLLLVDDMYGPPTERNATAPFVTLKGAWPMEAEQDSFYNARGGFPDSLHILAGQAGATSVPGSFADFDYDTLDYSAWPTEGISLATLSQYHVVAWYTDQASTANSGAKFASARPATAIRFLNTVNQQNTLGEYLAQGGKAWLFGDGTTTAIANGYYSRITGAALPRLPYTTGDDPRTNILVPGNFLYDFVHLRSQLEVTQLAPSALTNNSRLVSCLPYLPQYALPAGQTVPADRSLDPRVGASAQRTLADGWGGLPRLTVAQFRGSTGSVNGTFVVNRPLSVLEGTGTAAHATLDTLYLCMAKGFDPNGVNQPTSDGMPNGLWYHGSDNGEVVWFGFPLYDFEPDQARQAVAVVLTQLGVPRAAPGTAGAHPAGAAPTAPTTSGADPISRR